MEKEFEEYWALHQKHLILNAPEKLRAEYLESKKLDTPMDWLCFIIPIGVGILVQPMIKMGSEILSWGIMLVVVVVLFTLMQMIKPYVSKKKTEQQVLENIKNYYYERYKKYGDFTKIEPWQD